MELEQPRCQVGRAAAGSRRRPEITTRQPLIVIVDAVHNVQCAVVTDHRPDAFPQYILSFSLSCFPSSYFFRSLAPLYVYPQLPLSRTPTSRFRSLSPILYPRFVPLFLSLFHGRRNRGGGDWEGPSPPGPTNSLSWVGPGVPNILRKWALFTSLGLFFSNCNNCIGGFGPFETLGDPFPRGPPKPCPLNLWNHFSSPALFSSWTFASNRTRTRPLGAESQTLAILFRLAPKFGGTVYISPPSWTPTQSRLRFELLKVRHSQAVSGGDSRLALAGVVQTESTGYISSNIPSI